MSPRTDTREKILSAADQLMRQRGFNGFSYQDIAKPLGIRNAAVHYHFPTKADLAVELVEGVRRMLRERTRNFMENGGDARGQLEAFFAFSMQECTCDHTVCPVGAIASDFFSLPEPVREAGRRLVDDLVTWMTRVCEVGRAQGQFRFEGAAQAKAEEILAALQGARQIARFRGAATVSGIIDQLRRDLGLPTSKP
jgi:TetR/AcrR family transcriptional repressor of nem operon